jgi:hypothetical protein
MRVISDSSSAFWTVSMLKMYPLWGLLVEALSLAILYLLRRGGEWFRAERGCGRPPGSSA